MGAAIQASRAKSPTTQFYAIKMYYKNIRPGHAKWPCTHTNALEMKQKIHERRHHRIKKKIQKKRNIPEKEQNESFLEANDHYKKVRLIIDHAR